MARQLTATAAPSATPAITNVVGVLEADKKYRDAMLGFFRLDAPSVVVIDAPDCGALTQLVDAELAKGGRQAFAMVVHNDIMGSGIACLETELIRKYPQAEYVVYGYAQLNPDHKADLEKIGTKFFSKDFASTFVRLVQKGASWEWGYLFLRRANPGIFDLWRFEAIGPV